MGRSFVVAAPVALEPAPAPAPALALAPALAPAPALALALAPTPPPAPPPPARPSAPGAHAGRHAPASIERPKSNASGARAVPFIRSTSTPYQQRAPASFRARWRGC